MAVDLSMSVCNYDRTAALFDGRAPIEGCDVTAVPLVPEESFHRAFKYQEFDVTEMSMSSYLLTTARGDAHYVAIPAFVSRLFRHCGIYIRTDRGIKKPEDLKGKTIGLPEYQMTANVWVRGMLQEEYGVKPRDIKWRRGGLEEAGPRGAHEDQAAAGDRTAGDPEGPHALRHAGEGRNRRAAQRAGAVCFLRGVPNVGAAVPGLSGGRGGLLQEDQAVSDHACDRHPPSLVEKHPWLAVSVYKAFLKAKALCMHELGEIGHLHVTLPWPVHEYERAAAR